MGWISRVFGKRTDDGATDSRPSTPSTAKRETIEHLTGFVESRKGVEAYVEPENKDTPPTIILIATTGEWTRRRVPSEQQAWETAQSLGVPVYNVRFTGYPQRMRDWNSQQRARRN